MSEWVLEIMEGLGYLGLFLVLVIENVFPPIPSELVLPLAGFLVGLGQFNFWGAVAASTFGAVFGAWVLYALGRWGGRPVVLRYGRVLRVTEKDLANAEGWFERYGDWVVLFARLVPLARSIVSIPAGTMRMPILRFTLLTTLGTGAWNILLIYAGYLLGENWEAVSRWAGAYSDVVVFLMAVATVVFIAFEILRRRAGKRAG
ncbi:MAG: DedA family protein [Rubrobacteraceae bacterium]